MTRDDIVRMAREVADISTDYRGREEFIFDSYGVERFAHSVAAAEREACAKLLDEMAAKDRLTNYYVVAALAIRERGAP